MYPIEIYQVIIEATTSLAPSMVSNKLNKEVELTINQDHKSITKTFLPLERVDTVH